MDTEERFKIVKRGTAEIVTEEEMKALLAEKTKPSIYIGRATTGPLHIGHLISIGKLLDFSRAGFEAKILLADIHAALDDLKAKWEDLDKRVNYTKACIELSFDWKNGKPKFFKGSDFELKHDYVLDTLKISTMSTVERAMRAASEVTRMKNPKVSELIYPIMQAVDEQYLDVDVQLGGTDQRHILMFAREYLPLIGYRKRVEVMMPLVSSLLGPGTKMSSSIPNSNIKVYESEESIKKKINGAYCPEKETKDNFVLQIVNYIVFAAEDKFKIERASKFGGDVVYTSYEELEKDFVNGSLHPLDLKKAVGDYLSNRLKTVRDYFEKHHDLLEELGPEFLPQT
ncbi:tyrosine--tRNA ligase [Candidatus Parvarchaeota archaeon]|uniref:Tyrosine--tRNA ligase n=2 Tax=Candidatus Acidifodinimicrobium mancum TaxID=2898728 RepID=A0A8T3V099_9ARCH|nr:tyrosine--tRNA ligase [Candidatus Acidifodinimicrobium mancum]MBE5728827.1 tyrosine--tRNA ligase [Candidatus Acidifodinimicrobium mancum]MBE5730049.1 tyrosine--tRNA ligase [Candidatus Acidifodinimicrobium mancum]